MAHKIITIGCQFGSGGHSIGQETADHILRETGRGAGQRDRPAALPV